MNQSNKDRNSGCHSISQTRQSHYV